MASVLGVILGNLDSVVCEGIMDRPVGRLDFTATSYSGDGVSQLTEFNI